jgi:hypothetical protein
MIETRRHKLKYIKLCVFTGRKSASPKARSACGYLGFTRRVFMQLQINVEDETNISQWGGAPHAGAVTIAPTVTVARISAWYLTVILLTGGKRLPA